MSRFKTAVAVGLTLIIGCGLAPMRADDTSGELGPFDVCASRAPAPDLRASPLNRSREQWVASSMIEMQTIKAGMTRRQLSRVFTTEGGISSPADRVYVYRDCGYFKVRVKFQPATASNESPDDRISSISEPFIQFAVYD